MRFRFFPALRRPLATLTLTLGFMVMHTAGLTAAPRALPEGTRPADARLGPLKDLDGYFPFQPPATRDAWNARAENVRRRILVSQGLWPMPTRTPLNAVIHGRIEREDYTIEKVYFESAPGFFVTGNLYRPKTPRGRVPAVLFAHGHWKDARLSFETDPKLRAEIASGQERFEQGGRSRFQSLCVQLARMGCVVWQWDMLSDSDSVQFSADVIHLFKQQRPEMNAPDAWGLFSPQAEARLQSVMGLQTWNAVRSLDFVLTLPEVDPARVAITGASGGGTQTMLLAAIDPRIALSFPAVMVSTAMQGGCTCENASLLRVGTGNVEFAALFAPKPQGMTTANDWTIEMAQKGFPELRQLYGLLGAKDAVMLHRGEHFPHNYNAVSRSAFYTWLNRHFGLGCTEPVIERDYEPLPREQLTVWGEGHPAPKAADPDFERSLLRWFADDTEAQLRPLLSRPDRFREVAGAALEIMIGRTPTETGDVVWSPKTRRAATGYREEVGLVRNTTHAEEIPVIWLRPHAATPTLRTVVWLDDAGKASLYADDGTLRPAVQRLVEAGCAVIGADLLGQGEFLAAGEAFARTPKVASPREFAGYTFGYNASVAAQRTHDLFTLLAVARREGLPVDVAAFGSLAPVAAAARALAGDQIARAALSTGGFRFAQLRDFRDPRFLPGGAKYLDLPGLLALAAPQPLWLAGEDSGATPVADLYRLSETPRHLHLFRGAPKDEASAAATWLARAE
jgi:dienelactone hydrolase